MVLNLRGTVLHDATVNCMYSPPCNTTWLGPTQLGTTVLMTTVSLWPSTIQFGQLGPCGDVTSASCVSWGVIRQVGHSGFFEISEFKNQELIGLIKNAKPATSGFGFLLRFLFLNH
jgi:hypothetical protein